MIKYIPYLFVRQLAKETQYLLEYMLFVAVILGICHRHQHHLNKNK